ncbi:serine/threonine-protein kinase [Streptomyces synnematoformans]|uniref:non-specific serine/threonine protein kinase n=1 Tax=Streptomyces synnematoformans TaxID=415721 RepID=A0ABN2XFF8_9ACTN
MHPVGRGTVLRDRYRLLAPLGRGAMGQVWEGLDTHLERSVAVKLLVADLLADDAEGSRVHQRFEREAKAAAALDHVNVATVYDADITSGTYWLAMQLVRGATLGDLLGEHAAFGVDAATAVAAQLCAGLSAAHAVGLVHRDLKPANVMVRTDGVVKILDFGLVKPLAADATRLTVTGEEMGTAAYSAPEVLTGEHEADVRSDLYSLGCLLYQLLTGAPPFPAEQPARLLRQRLTGPPPAPEEHGVTVPDAVARLLARLMAPAARDRPESAACVYDALRPFLPRQQDGSSPATHSGPEDPRRPFTLPMSPYPYPS